MSTRSISLLVLLACVAALLAVSDIRLIVLAGVRLALLPHGGGHRIASRVVITDGSGIGHFLPGRESRRALG